MLIYHAKTRSIQPYPGSGRVATVELGSEALGPVLAAAPAMLAALEDMLDLTGPLSGINHIRRKNKARAAIAAARGEAAPC